MARRSLAASWAAQGVAASILGLAAFAINQFEFSPGWGVRIAVGNALIYALAHRLRPAALVAAISLSSLAFVAIWSAVWPWALATFEATVIALLSRKRSSVLIDVCFWLSIAAVFAAAILGFATDPFKNGFKFALAAMALNGMLCVIAGNLARAMLTWLQRGKLTHVETIAIDGTALSFLWAIVLFPALLLIPFLINEGHIWTYYPIDVSGKISHILEIITKSSDIKNVSSIQSTDGIRFIFSIFFIIVLLFVAGTATTVWVNRSLERIEQSSSAIAKLSQKVDQFDSLASNQFTDLTAKLAAVGEDFASMAQERRRLATIANQAPVVLYAIAISRSQRDRPKFIGQAAKEMLGCTSAELQEADFWPKRIHPEDHDLWDAAFSDLNAGAVRRAEYRLRHGDGGFIWVYDTLVIEIDPLSLEPEGVGALIDITDRKVAAAELVQADKLAGLGRVLAGVTHELNQPLNFIKLAAFNLRRQLSEGAINRDRILLKLDRMMASISRAESVITQLRVFSRKPSSSQDTAPLATLLDNLMIVTSPQLELDNIPVETSGCASLSKTIVMPTVLEQVLLNLLVNARDAIVERRRKGNAEPGLIKVAARMHDDKVMISIEDNGTGIPLEHKESIFEPFFTTKPPLEGTGLGLAVSYGIIRDHGGILTAENTPEGGALFTIEMPLLPV